MNAWRRHGSPQRCLNESPNDSCFVGSANDWWSIYEKSMLVSIRDLVDVGPVLRRFLTRADDVFDDLLFLTLVEELIRGQVPE